MTIDAVSADAEAAESQAIGWERTVNLWTWASVPDLYAPPTGDPLAERWSLDIGVTLRADPLTSVMLVLVTFVGSLVVGLSLNALAKQPSQTSQQTSSVSAR